MKLQLTKVEKTDGVYKRGKLKALELWEPYMQFLVFLKVVSLIYLILGPEWRTIDRIRERTVAVQGEMNRYTFDGQSEARALTTQTRKRRSDRMSHELLVL